jgi:hypothetical protein
MKRASILAGAGVALAGLTMALALASCGLRGELDRPNSPLWGPKSKADYAQAKRDQAAAASNSTAQGKAGQPPQSGPGSDPYSNLAPPSQAPIPGERTNPSGAPPSLTP